ncbi:MAG TPA: hypothetical protein DCY93_03870 [Firmicutes bacterium]|nr:hypothetical protein [Bacillota bacterium]
MKNKLNIIYEDEEVIVCNKRSNQLTIGKDYNDFNSLYHEVYEYVHKKTGGRIFVVHRLDKDTSGIIIFAKTGTVKEKLQLIFENHKVERKYEAVVEGKMKGKGTIKVNLSEDKFHNVFVTKKGVEAITKYEVLNVKDNRSLLDIELVTGKRNQIRASLSFLGHTIIGDKKYNGIKNNRLLLNAYKLVFPNGTLKVNEFQISKLFNL